MSAQLLLSFVGGVLWLHIHSVVHPCKTVWLHLGTH